jgi:DNA-binding response OmpR family regulator
MIRWSLGEALRGWGFDPVEAATAGHALSAFETEPPAAVLLDINLPDGSGLDVLRKMRQREPEAVIIMITANVLVDETIAALRGGAYDFIANRSTWKSSMSLSVTASRPAACGTK